MSKVKRPLNRSIIIAGTVFILLLGIVISVVMISVFTLSISG